MDQNTKTITATAKKSGGGSLGWVLPGIAALVLAKTVGMFPAIAAFVTYYGLKEKFGIAISLLASVVVAGAVFVATLAYFVHSEESARQRSEQHDTDIKDLSVPPVLSERMANPSWTIAYWISADKKVSDCIRADEYMDDKTMSKAIGTKTYHINDYISSCQNRIARSLEYVEPAVRKWCAYRHTSARLETLCREWEQNKARYLASIEALDGPTLNRYRAFIGQ